MAKLIYSDGRCEEVKPAHRVFTIGEVTTLIGGSPNIVMTRKNQVMLIDEHGPAKRKEVNKVATQLYVHGDKLKIRGDVLIVSRREFK